MSAIVKNSGGKAEFVDACEEIGTDVDTITVRGSVINVFPVRPADATAAQTLALIEQSGTLSFWAQEGEDIYTHDDGEAI